MGEKTLVTRAALARAAERIEESSVFDRAERGRRKNYESLHLHHGDLFDSHSWAVRYKSLRKRQSLADLNSAKRNLKDCCGLPLQETTTRCVAETSRSILMPSLVGHVMAGCSSIFRESFADSQKRPGAERSVGFSETGAIHTRPRSVAQTCAGLSTRRHEARIVIARKGLLDPTS